MYEKYKNTPGSKQALNDGCICPVMDNHNGEGSGYFDCDGYPVFWFNYNCPLHGKLPDIAPDTILTKCIKTLTDT